MSAPTEVSVKPRVHPVDEVLPVPKLALYGFQHVVAFYAGAVLVPIIIAGAINLPQEDLVKLITADLFTCGIASIIQAVGFWKIGVRLPLLQGVTFAGVSPIIAIGLAHGGGAASLLYVYGAVIVAGVFTFLIAPIFIKLLRFFPPVVTGTLITIIGLCLVPVGALDAVTNPHTHEHGPDQHPVVPLRAGHHRHHRRDPATLPRLPGHHRGAARPGHRLRGRLRAGRHELRQGRRGRRRSASPRRSCSACPSSTSSRA